jgi:hypothetical protein
MYEIVRDTNGGKDMLVDCVPLLDVGRMLYAMRLEFPTAYAVRVVL